jgi:hypothetical protein
LGVFRIIIFHVFERDARFIEFFVFNVITGGGSADVVCGADMLENLDQAVGFLPSIPGISDERMKRV